MVSILTALILTSLVCATVGNGGTADTSEWNEVVSIVQPLLERALEEHGDGSVVSSVGKSEEIDKYIDLSQFVSRNSKHFTITNVVDSGSRIDDSNHVETVSSFLTLSCICGDYNCETPFAFDMTGAIEDDNQKYLGKTPLLFLDENETTLGCLSRRLQYIVNDVELEGCDVVSSNDTKEMDDDYLHVKNCSKIEDLRITNHSKVIARPLSETELFPDNMEESSVQPTEKVSTFLEDFGVPKITIDMPAGKDIDLTDKVKKVQAEFIKSLVHNVFHVMLPETFNDDSHAADATIADYFRILMEFSIRRMPKTVKSKTGSSALSGDPLYLDLIASRPETTALPEIISGNVLLALSAGTFGWFAGVLALFELFIASLAFGAELAAFTLRWKAEVDLENWEEDMVLVETISASRNKEIPLGVGRDMNPMTVSITIAMLVNSEDRSTEMAFLIAGAVIAGVSLVCASFMGYKKKQGKGSGVDASKVSSEEPIKLEPTTSQAYSEPQEQTPNALEALQTKTANVSSHDRPQVPVADKLSMPPVKVQCVASAPQLALLTSTSVADRSKQIKTGSAEIIV